MHSHDDVGDAIAKSRICQVFDESLLELDVALAVTKLFLVIFDVFPRFIQLGKTIKRTQSSHHFRRLCAQGTL